MNYVCKTILVALFYFLTEGVSAQNRFKASVMLGLNSSQIHGDNQDGYKKKGFNTGLIGSIIVKPNFDICTEILYNEKGTARSGTSLSRNGHFYSDIFLKYSEAALLGHFYFRPQITDGSGYYKQSIKLGVSYGRLLKSETQVTLNNTMLNEIEQELTQNYNRDDFSLVVSWLYHFSPRISLGIRHTNTLNILYKNKIGHITTREDFENLRPYFFSFQLVYDFITPKNVKITVKKRKSLRRDPLEEL